MTGIFFVDCLKVSVSVAMALSINTSKIAAYRDLVPYITKQSNWLQLNVMINIYICRSVPFCASAMYARVIQKSVL